MRLILNGLVALAIAISAAGVAAAADSDYPTTEIWIETARDRHHFTIEIAATRKQHARGLMFREELAADAGMLFDYDPPQRVSMWMKNTLIPLDMLFVRADGTIGRIAAWTTPLSLEAIPSGGPVRAVIELKGGITQQLGIKIGDTVVHPIFQE